RLTSNGIVTGGAQLQGKHPSRNRRPSIATGAVSAGDRSSRINASRKTSWHYRRGFFVWPFPKYPRARAAWIRREETSRPSTDSRKKQNHVRAEIVNDVRQLALVGLGGAKPMAVF